MHPVRCGASAGYYTEQGPQVVTLGLVLAACEAATGVHSWRNPNRSTTAYLTFLADHGYTLSDVEQLACGHPQPDSGDSGYEGVDR